MSEFDWDGYYAAMRGRSPRPNLLLALKAWGDRPPGNAIDLGAGDGVDSRALAEAGWRVTALDGEPRIAQELRDVSGVEIVVRRFEQLDELAASDLVFSGFALPFCPPEHFEALWQKIRASLRPGGLLAVELFGVNDEWAGRASMTFHSRAQVERMLDGLEIVHLEEAERDGRSFDGPKHWHVFHVVARRPDGTDAA
ncbi:Methyltransferase domain-containing protein [Paramicrobacterium humi]|uniref:Methyltransferase domain-containing protein n=1 Tax=Paramicrobacterium humi TaxID=640635 RepID=A0A1H4IRT5_9MICO|nr:class I SAM-dependent methyltransferase [Microbacterium humi]SEB36356.1 Methyltransferase domain-containing protein [Microbacterium humi]